MKTYFPLLIISLLLFSCQSENVKPQNSWEGSYTGTFTLFQASWVYYEPLDPDSLPQQWLDTTYESGEVIMEVSVDRSENNISFFTSSKTRLTHSLNTDGEFTLVEGDCYQESVIPYDPFQDQTLEACFQPGDSLIFRNAWSENLGGGADEAEWVMTFRGKK